MNLRQAAIAFNYTINSPKTKKIKEIMKIMIK